MLEDLIELFMELAVLARIERDRLPPNTEGLPLCSSRLARPLLSRARSTVEDAANWEGMEDAFVGTAARLLDLKGGMTQGPTL